MLEKIYEEFETRPWDIDEDKERMERLEECIQVIRCILENEELEMKDKVSEIEYEIKSLE